MNKTWEKGKKRSFGSDLANLAQILTAKFSFQKSGTVHH